MFDRVLSRFIVLSGSQSDAQAAGAEGAPASTRRLQRALLLLAPLLYVFEPLHHDQVSERYLAHMSHTRSPAQLRPPAPVLSLSLSLYLSLSLSLSLSSSLSLSLSLSASRSLSLSLGFPSLPLPPLPSSHLPIFPSSSPLPLFFFSPLPLSPLAGLTRAHDHTCTHTHTCC